MRKEIPVEKKLLSGGTGNYCIIFEIIDTVWCRRRLVFAGPIQAMVSVEVGLEVWFGLV